MIPWFYIIPAVVFGATAGILIIALVSMNDKDE